MSLYIPGMEMPTSCSKCPFCDDDFDDNYFGLCCSLTGTRFDGDERISDCPLIEVPPHGRLVDADALEKQAVFSFDTDEDIIFMDDLHDAPTIIPADKEET